MAAIERCRTAALGGHVARCEDCAHTLIAYNSCRNRHCPKCQGAAAKEWLAERKAELLPVPYFHVVFSLPGRIADIAYQNKAVIYDLLLTISGPERYKLMRLATDEFIRRFLMHVLPAGFHRIRYYGLLASGKRAENV